MGGGFRQSGKSSKEGGVKNACYPSGGGVYFFWNNPVMVVMIGILSLTEE